MEDILAFALMDPAVLGDKDDLFVRARRTDCKIHFAAALGSQKLQERHVRIMQDERDDLPVGNF